VYLAEGNAACELNGPIRGVGEQQLGMLATRAALADERQTLGVAHSLIQQPTRVMPDGCADIMRKPSRAVPPDL
jgi:hypothetical protein